MTAGRSAGKTPIARSIWYAGIGVVEIRSAELPPMASDAVRVRTHFSGVSRGTERLVLNGLIPDSEVERMRAPLQEGDFPFPVKYGYAAAGVVEAGVKELVGRAVFCLHPHQDVFQVSAGLAVPLPDGLPIRRATLAANMETALNALWDSGAGPADRIVVVGAGIVGLLVAYLSARLPGAEVTVIDPVADRRSLVDRLGGRFLARPSEPDIAASADVVFHASATAAGLSASLAAAGREATIVDLSWYGATNVSVPLGGAFHSQRLRLVSSQVGQVSAGHRPRWSYRRRLEAALALLQDPVLDGLVTREVGFDEAPAILPRLLAVDSRDLAPVLRYSIPSA